MPRRRVISHGQAERPSAPLGLQLPEPDPGLHRLLAGAGNLPSPHQCDPLANGIDLSLLEHVSPIEWDNVVLYGQYILDRKLVRQRRRAKRVGLSV